MAVERSIFVTRTWACPACGSTIRVLGWDYDPPPTCCNTPMHIEGSRHAAPAVIGDEIDWTIRHGVCNEDGTPRRFRSRAEWKQACVESGWTPMGDTPKTKEERNRWY